MSTVSLEKRGIGLCRYGGTFFSLSISGKGGAGECVREREHLWSAPARRSVPFHPLDVACFVICTDALDGLCFLPAVCLSMTRDEQQ